MAKSAKIATYFDIPQSPELDSVHLRLAQNQNRLNAVLRDDYGRNKGQIGFQLPPLRSYDDLQYATGPNTLNSHPVVIERSKSRRRSNAFKDKFRKVFSRSAEGREPTQGKSKLQKQQPESRTLTSRSFSTSRSCPVTRPETPVRSRSPSMDVDEKSSTDTSDFHDFVSTVAESHQSPTSRQEPLRSQPVYEESDTLKSQTSARVSPHDLSPVVEAESPRQRSGSLEGLRDTVRLAPGRGILRDSNDTIRPNTSHSETAWSKLSQSEIRGRTGSEPAVSYSQERRMLSPASSLKTRKSSSQTATRSAMEATSIAARLAQLEQRLEQLEDKVQRMELNGKISARLKGDAERLHSSDVTAAPYFTPPPSQHKPSSSERSWLSHQSSEASLQTPLTSPALSLQREESYEDEENNEAAVTPKAAFLLGPSSSYSHASLRGHGSQEQSLHSRSHSGGVSVLDLERTAETQDKSTIAAGQSRSLHPRYKQWYINTGLAVTSKDDAAVQPSPKSRITKAEKDEDQPDSSKVSYSYGSQPSYTNLQPGSRFSAFDTDEEADDPSDYPYMLTPKSFTHGKESPSRDNNYRTSTTPPPYSHEADKQQSHWNWRGDEGLALAM